MIMKPKSKEKPRHCGHKIMMRVQRARQARREMSAQGAAVQLLAIFSALVSALPLLPAARASSSPSGEPEPNADAAAAAPRPPKELYMSGAEAMAFIRRHKPTRVSAKLKVAKEALLRDIPAAGDFIKDAFNHVEWTDLLRCYVADDLPATARAIEARAVAWRNEKSRIPAPRDGNDPQPK